MSDTGRKFPRRFVVYIVVAVVGGFTSPLWYPHTPAGRQRRILRAANEYITAFKPQIDSEARYATLKFIVSTSGAIVVVGEVPTEPDVDALREKIVASNPPVPVNFHVATTGNPGVSPRPYVSGAQR